MPTETRIGTVVAGFRLISRIGQGAMGTVYLAEEARTGTRVALKLLIPGLADDERFRQRFLREASIAASLDHPNIVPTVTFGETDGLLYLVMAYVEGPDLRQLLHRDGALEPRRALRFMAQVAAALDAAHRAGLVHRDVKPGNIIIANEGEAELAYVCDFGLARHVSSASSLTNDRGFVGTIDYVPPEQIRGETLDGRADVYSLGCVLFECLSGVRPFLGESELAVVFAHLNERAPLLSQVRPDLSSGLDDVFTTALAKTRDKRFPTCAALVQSAQSALDGRASAHRPPWRILALVGVAILAIAAFGLFATTRGTSPRAAPAISQDAIAGDGLGLLASAYKNDLGASRRTTLPGAAYPMLVFDAKAVAVYFPDQANGPSIIITTWNRTFRTAKGVGPCSTVEALKRAYGGEVKPGRWGTQGPRINSYVVGPNLLFAVNRAAAIVSAVALYDGRAPGADKHGGAQAFANYAALFGPQCVA